MSVLQLESLLLPIHFSFFITSLGQRGYTSSVAIGRKDPCKADAIFKEHPDSGTTLSER
jgi:hypothetical protein